MDDFQTPLQQAQADPQFAEYLRAKYGIPQPFARSEEDEDER
jgi:hypothetical protein